MLFPYNEVKGTLLPAPGDLSFANRDSSSVAPISTRFSGRSLDLEGISCSKEWLTNCITSGHNCVARTCNREIIARQLLKDSKSSDTRCNINRRTRGVKV